MNKKQLIAKEIEQVPEPMLKEVLDFVRFLKGKRMRKTENGSSTLIAINDPGAI